jgi:hypothetical protein
MAAFDHDWDSLPGETSTHVVDIEEAVARAVKAIDDGDTSYGLSELKADLERVRDLAARSIADIDATGG